MIDIFESTNRSKENPFADDFLNTEKNVKRTIDEFLTKNNNIGKGTVVGLSSPFGSGKSTFIEMSRFYIEKKETTEDKKKRYVSVYINLSKNEFHNNPLLIVLKSICRAIANKSKDDQYIKIIIVKLIKLALRMTAPFDTTLYLEESEQTNEKLYDKLIEDDDVSKEKFLLYLEEIVENKEVVVFLDDIDRCSPNFAIKILEQLKLYFEVLNIKFIVSYDRNQLEGFLQKRFGENIDVEGYLQKFFDYNYMFSPLNKEEFENFINKTTLLCIKYIQLRDSKKINKIIETLMDETFEIYLKKYSLRDLQQIIFRIVFGLKFLEDKGITIPPLVSSIIVLLVLIRRTDRKLYTHLYNGNIDGIDFCYNLLQDKNFNKLFERDLYIPLLAFDIKCMSTENWIDNISSCKQKKQEKSRNLKENKTISSDSISNKIIAPLSNINHIEEYMNTVKLCFDILEYD